MKTITKKSVILTSITSLALVLSMATAHAKIYKWTDANGQTHYTAQPPTQKKLRDKAKNIEDKIRANAGKYRPTQKTEKTASKTEAATENTGKEEKLSGPNKQLINYCKSQRNNVAQLKKNFRNVWIDAKGKKTTLNQEQRRKKVAELQNKIKTDCSDVPTSVQKS